jgi:ubiquinone/menaquinone biosynthesis C-methylase UbiE
VAFGTWLDQFLYRRPFEGRSARRYADDERPAFADLDERLLDRLGRCEVLLDVGSGPATFARAAAARFPALRVLAIDPSHEFSRQHPGIEVARASGEALPLADRSVDVAICLSSIRHVQDRATVLAELRRVVRGKLIIVELDPTASAARIAQHANRITSPILRAAFGPLVVRTAPPVSAIEDLALAAGWRRAELRDDPVQPVYILELT